MVATNVAAPIDPMVGRTISDNFRLLAAIGSGAMGTIYKAQQLSLGKTVVIKLLHRHLLGDPTLSKRFHREAQTASRLNHPNVIQIIDFGQMENGSLYIAMEHVPGVDLSEMLFRDFPLDPRRTIHILKQSCFALDEAHANSVLHRDLKPENIMVGDRRNMKDFVKVLDFGIAKLQDGVAEANSFQTVAGVVCGTPEYMSPEQARGDKLDGRTDLYALGIILYQMLSNRLPFEGESALGIVTKHLTEKPVPPSKHQSGVPRGLENLCLSLLAKDRDQRPASALDVAAELERLDREIEAARLRQIGTEEADRTWIEVRASTLEAPTPNPHQAGVDDTRREGPGDLDRTEPGAAPVPAAARAVMPATRRGPRPRPGFAARETPSHDVASAARLWVIALLVSAVVALIGWFVYRALVPTQQGTDPASHVVPATPLASPTASAMVTLEPGEVSAPIDALDQRLR